MLFIVLMTLYLPVFIVYDWRHEEVLLWLHQLSPTLDKLYKSNFVKHDIMGKGQGVSPISCQSMMS